ncbi:MAG: hypothetical protein HOO96_06385 [Polyangiaceae bacterium]|nr:hypothetical protein [Polyangiaceae bacterium]
MLHPPSGVTFPSRVDRFRRDAVFRYDEAGENVSVRYVHDPRNFATVYVFPAMSRTESEFVHTFEAAAKDMLRSLGTASVTVVQRNVAVARSGGALVSGRFLRARTRPGPGADTWARTATLELFVWRWFFLKLRVDLDLRAGPGFGDAWFARFLEVP